MYFRLLDRFFNKIKFNESTFCWDWKGTKDWNNYGRLWSKKQLFYSHRLSYLLFKGFIPKGLVIDHLCENRFCVNPEHLEAVTQKTNVLRSQGFAGVNKSKKYCPQGHEYSKENLHEGELQRGRRSCKICMDRSSRMKNFRKSITVEWCQ